MISGITGRINRAVWGPGNRTIITAGEDATIRIWDSEVSIPCLHVVLLSPAGDWFYLIRVSACLVLWTCGNMLIGMNL